MTGSPTRKKNRAGTVLLVDDSDQLRRFAAHILTEEGFDVLEAVDAEEGIAIYRQWADSIDLVVTDIHMPGKSGLELADYVSSRNSDLPLLFISSHSTEVLSRIFASTREFLSKPFRADALVHKVRKMIGTMETASAFQNRAMDSETASASSAAGSPVHSSS
jgi:two-component system, cell cycle sensor histidine kinase and response regulator CckA